MSGCLRGLECPTGSESREEKQTIEKREERRENQAKENKRSEGKSKDP